MEKHKIVASWSTELLKQTFCLMYLHNRDFPGMHELALQAIRTATRQQPPPQKKNKTREENQKGKKYEYKNTEWLGNVFNLIPSYQ